MSKDIRLISRNDDPRREGDPIEKALGHLQSFALHDSAGNDEAAALHLECAVDSLDRALRRYALRRGVLFEVIPNDQLELFH